MPQSPSSRPLGTLAARLDGSRLHKPLRRKVGPAGAGPIERVGSDGGQARCSRAIFSRCRTSSDSCLSRAGVSFSARQSAAACRGPAGRAQPTPAAVRCARSCRGTGCEPSRVAAQGPFDLRTGSGGRVGNEGIQIIGEAGAGLPMMRYGDAHFSRICILTFSLETRTNMSYISLREWP